MPSKRGAFRELVQELMNKALDEDPLLRYADYYDVHLKLFAMALDELFQKLHERLDALEKPKDPAEVFTEAQLGLLRTIEQRLDGRIDAIDSAQSNLEDQLGIQTGRP